MRGLAWALLRPRTWVAIAVAYGATMLAAGDGQPGWTLVVAVATFSLAGLSGWAHYLEDRDSREESEEGAEGEGDELPAEEPSTHDRWVAESVRRYEEQVEARLAALKEQSGPQ